MKSALTDISIILDRSGSMKSMSEAVVRGINKLIEDQKDIPGETCWSLALFDDGTNAARHGEAFPRVVWENIPQSRVPLLEPADFVPRGGTALIDACCVYIEKLRAAYLALEEDDRPRVMVVIMTDGEENSSLNFTRENLRGLMSETQEKYRWNYLFLGANIDAFATVNSYGAGQYMNYGGLASGSSNALPFVATTDGVFQTICSGGVGLAAWKAHCWLEEKTGGALVNAGWQASAEEEPVAAQLARTSETGDRLLREMKSQSAMLGEAHDALAKIKALVSGEKP